MRILIIGHAFSPGRGSEPGLTWNWAHYLSKHHEIWVLAHPEFRDDVERYLELHPNQFLHVVWLVGSSRLDYWDHTKGQRGVRWHFLLWQREAEQIAKQLHEKLTFDLIHHVSMATISAPPTIWKLGVPLIWGPIGGAQKCPPSLACILGRGRWREYLRDFRIYCLPWLPLVRKACNRAALVLATNTETLELIQKGGAKHSEFFLDNGLPDDIIPVSLPTRVIRSQVKVLWASKVLRWKALPLAIEALAVLKVDPCESLVKLAVAGDGPDLDRCRRLAHKKGVSQQIEFLGEVHPARMREQFESADIFLFTSIRDSCASVVLEAMCYGLPVVTFDIHGVGAYMPPEAGIKIKCRDRASTIRDMAAALKQLASDPVLRAAQGAAGQSYARTQTWSKRAERMDKLYLQCLAEPRLGAGAVLRK